MRKLLDVEVLRCSSGTFFEISSFRKPHHSDGLIVRFSKGRLISWIETKDGGMHGRELFWSESGELIKKGEHKNGFEDGDHLLWDEKGRPKSFRQYKEGRLHGMSREWQDGVLIGESTFKSWVKHGIIKKFFQDGRFLSIQLWKKGDLVEEWSLESSPCRIFSNDLEEEMKLTDFEEMKKAIARKIEGLGR